jgi:toxin ParE1/3/4
VLTLVWSDNARTDVREAIGYIADQNTQAAERLNAAIESCAERLPEHPFMYRAGRVPGTREAVIHPNYLLVYRVTAEAVEIVSLMHARQQYP